MEFEALANTIFEELKPKLENNDGLAIFAKNRAKFEGWLKVELCGSLSKYFGDIVPEHDTPLKKKIDIVFKNWAVQLKTVNTNYRYRGVEIKTRPITMNIQGVIEDIGILKSTDYENEAILFLAFPVTHDNEYWQDHYQKIRTYSKDIRHSSFYFNNGVPGVIYFCLIN
jgi:hypothetical protein